MKTVLLLIITLMIACGFYGCTSVNKIGETSNAPMYEWVSPDGVHYWIYHAGYSGGMSPRYGSDGCIMIDEVSK